MGPAIEWGPPIQGGVWGNLALSGTRRPGLVDVTVGLLSGCGELCEEEVGTSRIPSGRPVLSWSDTSHLLFDLHTK